MCMVIHLSTTSELDLSAFDDPESAWSFKKIAEIVPTDGHLLSCHPNKWHVSRYGGCSCNFRQAPHDWYKPAELSFGPREEWWTEDEENNVATAAVYDVIQRLVSSGAQVDCVQIWDGAEEPVPVFDVSLAEVPREDFRFGRGICYRFTAT